MKVDSTEEVQSERRQQRQRQIQQAEELLASVPDRLGFAKGLFWGQCIADWVFPYSHLDDDQQADVAQSIADLRQFCDEHLDPVAIDRQADIPPAVIQGLAELGVLGMTAPTQVGGRGYSQLAYCRLLEEIGARCSATSIFVNAHHSIGMRALLLFGTDEQKSRWLPDLVSGKKLAAFALTEPEAGSDAANVQTTATPSDDGRHYILNGQKRYITNGAIAEVLTVMARTPLPGRVDSGISAFLVTPDMPGFHVVEARMEKLGVRGTATARLEFDNMLVPAENLLGPLGKGLKVALTVLDYGRTTFGACCTGAAKTCLELAANHARTRRQFQRPLAQFELVRAKLARMDAWIYAMEAMTTVTASLIDRGLEDYMLETAMLKVYCTERLWTIVNDAFQIYGGAAYFTDQPLERMLRDHRINQIGEGANEVLISFIALSGMRGPGLQLKRLHDTVKRPWRDPTQIVRFIGHSAVQRFVSPAVPVRCAQLRPYAQRLGQSIRRLGLAVQRCLIRHGEEIVERQLVQQRLAWAAMEIFASASALSRWDDELARHQSRHNAAARLLLEESAAKTRYWLDQLHHNQDDAVRDAAAYVADDRLVEND